VPFIFCPPLILFLRPQLAFLFLQCCCIGLSIHLKEMFLLIPSLEFQFRPFDSFPGLPNSFRQQPPSLLSRFPRPDPFPSRAIPPALYRCLPGGHRVRSRDRPLVLTEYRFPQGFFSPRTVIFELASSHESMYVLFHFFVIGPPLNCFSSIRPSFSPCQRPCARPRPSIDSSPKPIFALIEVSFTAII